MLPLFYHVRRAGFGSGFLKCAGAFVVASALAAACGRATSEAVPSPAAQSAPPALGAAPTPPVNSAAEPQQTTPTAAAIASGRAIIERVRAAAGGPALTALRSVEAVGTSQMTAMKGVRELRIMALFPQFYRQEEAPPPGAKGRPLHITMGLQGDLAWMTGAMLGGEGRSPNREVAQRAYTRAVRQAMAGFLVGVNAAVADIVFTYRDYEPQVGLQLPHTIVRENGRNRTVWSIRRYTLNPRLSPRGFSRTGR